MWLGLVYFPSHDDEVILCAWSPGKGRPFAYAGARASVVQMARAMRVANANRAFATPRCDECCTPLDLPEI